MSVEIAKGFHAVQIVLKTNAKRVKALFLAKGRKDQRMQKLQAFAERQGVPIQWVAKEVLDGLCPENHQGVVAELHPGKTFAEKDLESIVSNTKANPLILVLDGVTDPHNLGACLRTADAVGVDAVVVPKDNSASLNDVARKVASGAAETVPLIAVTNLARTLAKLQELGLWITGTAGEATLTHYEADLRGPRVIVMGAEGKGMRRLTRECCDELVRIPMHGEVSSLNVSVATGVILFEVARQNRAT